ncbi:MAG TPA: SH3 domain-containing protein [Archangium sp.]
MTTLRLTVVAMTMALMGCATGTAGDIASDGELLEGAEEFGTLSSELSSGVPLGSTLRTSSGLNLRTSASMSATVRLVIPAGATVTTVNVTQPSGGWYNVRYNGVTGWSYGAYLNLVSSPSTGGGTTPPPTSGGAITRDAAITRAKGGVGFSYWWGHGRWIQNGATSSNKGVCTGSCPNCSHSGGYGADCSGYVAKVWGIPSNNTDTTIDSHPYGTIHFVGSGSNWASVSRANTQRGDAMVYNQNGAGHILIYESGDAWGSVWAYEARGCSYGIVHNLRSVTSAFKTIKRAGW